MKRRFVAAAFGVSALAFAAPASAQLGRSDAARLAYGDDRASYYDARRIAYDNGYREGVKEGEKDGRSRDPFEYRDEGDFRDGDEGYRREYGNREGYRQVFRSGFADGYRDGYSRYGGYNRGGWGNGRYEDRRPGAYGGYGNYGGYGGYGGYGRTSNFAFENGARDGYEKGLEDVRARRSADVLRHRWYRSGDRHYDSRYGSRQQYADGYRQGFREGYARGYREYRRW